MGHGVALRQKCKPHKECQPNTWTTAQVSAANPLGFGGSLWFNDGVCGSLWFSGSGSQWFLWFSVVQIPKCGSMWFSGSGSQWFFCGSVWFKYPTVWFTVVFSWFIVVQYPTVWFTVVQCGSLWFGVDGAVVQCGLSQRNLQPKDRKPSFLNHPKTSSRSLWPTAVHNTCRCVF